MKVKNTVQHVAKKVEIHEVLWDSEKMSLTLYYEDHEQLLNWVQRFGDSEQKTPLFLKEIHYDLNNPNYCINLLFAIRRVLAQKLDSKELYKLNTYESWFKQLRGVEVSLNEYGRLI